MSHIGRAATNHPLHLRDDDGDDDDDILMKQACHIWLGLGINRIKYRD